MHFASYSDEQTAPIKGYRAASAKAISWGPHNIIALATKHNIQFNLHSHSTHNPSTPMRCDVMEELKPSPATYIESVSFSPYLLSAEARDRVMISGSTSNENEHNKRKSTTSNSSLGAALCAFKTVSSTIDVIPVERVHATLETMKPIALGRRKITILPQLRPIPHGSAPQQGSNNNNSNVSSPHIPAFSYHLIDFHWLSAASLVLVTSIGLLYVDLCEEFDGVKKTLSPAAIHKLKEAQSIRYKKEARDATARPVRVKAEGGGERERENDNYNNQKEEEEEEDTLDLSLLDDLLKGITPSASNLSAQPSNSTPTTTTEPKRRLASWPQGFGPACSTIVEVDAPPISLSSAASSSSSPQSQLRSSSSTHHLLIVSGLLTVSGRQQNILLGYDLTTIAALFYDNPSQQQHQQQISTLETQTTCLCRCAFAINTSTKVFSIVTNFSRVVNSTALASSDSLVPSAISASIVASSAAGATPREAENISLRTPPPSMVGPGRRMNVVELILSGPSVTILAHLSTLSATVPIAVPKDAFSIVSSSASAAASSPLTNVPTVSTSITGAAIIARWGSSLGPVVVPPSSAASPLPSAQILAPNVDTISNHHQDPNVCRIIRLRGSGQGTLGGDGLMPLHGSGDSFSRRVLSSVDIVTTTQTIPSQTQGPKPLPPLSSASASTSTGSSASAGRGSTNNNNKKMTIAEKLIAAKAAQDAARKVTQPVVSESVTSPTTAAAATPQRERQVASSPALVSTVMAATIDSHYILVGSETITVIGIVRTHFNSTSSASATAPTTVTVYSDTIIDVLKIATMNHLAGIDSSVPPLAFVGGVAIHPSGSVGAMLAGVVRQRKDEIRLTPFTTPFAPLYSEAMVRFLEQRALLAMLSGAAEAEAEHSSGKKVDDNNVNDHNNYNNHFSNANRLSIDSRQTFRHFLSGGDKFTVTPPVDLISGENSNSNNNEGGAGSSVASLASLYAAHAASSASFTTASSSSSLAPNLLSAVGKVGDDCQRLKDLCFAILSGPKDPLENPAGALFFTTAASLLSYTQQQQNAFVKSISGSSNLVALLSQQPVLGHKGVFQLGSDLEKAISRAVISFVVSCVTGEAQMTYAPSTAVVCTAANDNCDHHKASSGQFVYNDAVTTAFYGDPSWDVQLIDPAAMIPTNQCVPAYLSQIETFTARLSISLCELCFEQVDSGQFVLSSTGGAAASGSSKSNSSFANFVWSQGRRSFGMDVYRRHPMHPQLHAKSAESSPTRRSMPAWQRSLVSVRTLIRCVEMHRTHSAAALDWLKLCRRRLTIELLFARAVTVTQIYLHTPSVTNGPSTTAVAVALAIIDAIIKATRHMELVAPSAAFIPHTSVASATDLVNKVLEKAKKQQREEEENDGQLGHASVAWLVNSEGTSSRVRVAQPHFLSSFSEGESANNEESQQVPKDEGGTKKAKKRRREAGADGSPFFSFVSAPLSVTLPAIHTDLGSSSGPIRREFLLVDAFTFEPIHAWGTESTLRCSSGCGQAFLERNPNNGGIACPLCLGQLVKE